MSGSKGMELFRGKEITLRANDLALLGRTTDQLPRGDAEGMIASRLTATTQPKPGMTQQQLSRIVHSLEDKCNTRIERVLTKLEEESKFRGRFLNAKQKADELAHRNLVLHQQLEEMTAKFETERAKKDPEILPKKQDWVDAKLVGLMQNHLAVMMNSTDESDTAEIRRMEGQIAAQKMSIDNLRKRLAGAKNEIKRILHEQEEKKRKILERKERLAQVKRGAASSTVNLWVKRKFKDKKAPLSIKPKSHGRKLWDKLKGRMKDVIKLGEKWIKQELRMQDLNNKLPMELRAERLERERKDREEKRKLAAKNRKAKEDAVAEAMRKKAEEEEKKYKESLLKLQKQEEEERDKLIAEILLRAEGSQEAMRRRPTVTIPGNPPLLKLNQSIKSKTLRKRLSPLATSGGGFPPLGSPGDKTSSSTARGGPSYLNKVKSPGRRRKLSALPNSRKTPRSKYIGVTRKKPVANPAASMRPADVHTIATNANIMKDVIKLLGAYESGKGYKKLSKEKLAISLSKADDVITQLGSQVNQLQAKLKASDELLTEREKECRRLFEHAQISEEKTVRLANENLQLLKAARYLEERNKRMRSEKKKNEDVNVEGPEFARLQLHYERGRQLVADMSEVISRLQTFHYHGNKLREGKGFTDPSDAEMLIRKNDRKFNSMFRKGSAALGRFDASCIEDLNWIVEARRPALQRENNGSKSARGPLRDAERELQEFLTVKDLELPQDVRIKMDIKPLKKKRKKKKKLSSFLVRMTKPTASSAAMFGGKKKVGRKANNKTSKRSEGEAASKAEGTGKAVTKGEELQSLTQVSPMLASILANAPYCPLSMGAPYCPLTIGSGHLADEKGTCTKCGVSTIPHISNEEGDDTLGELLLSSHRLRRKNPGLYSSRSNASGAISSRATPRIESYINTAPYCPASMGASHVWENRTCINCGALQTLGGGASISVSRDTKLRVGNDIIDLDEVIKKIPYQREKGARKLRAELFRRFDPNGNGYLSLAELDKGIRDVLNLGAVFDCKPAIMRAYQAARARGKNRSKVSGDYVETHEFRFFLFALRQYFEYFVVFGAIDSNMDRRIALAEFIRAAEMLNLGGEGDESPESLFKRIDVNNGGFILFDEFCAFAIARSLSVEEEEEGEGKERKDGEAGEKTLDGATSNAKERAEELQTGLEAAQKNLEAQKAMTAEEDGGDQSDAKAQGLAVGKGINWQLINEKLPIARDEESRERRREYFRRFDPNSNGYLSLAELDKGIRDVLELEAVFDCKPAIMRAYQAARARGKSKSKVAGDYIEMHEFRFFFVALRQFFEYFVFFNCMDYDMDRRISPEEFADAGESLKFPVVNNDYAAAFTKIDKNGGGFILFDEFCDFALAVALDLEGDEDEAGAKEDATAQEVKSGIAQAEINAKEDEEKCKEEEEEEKEDMKDVLKRINWNLINSKLPFAADEDSLSKRSELFRRFDPNGNGYLSLAELDKGIRDVLDLDDVFNCKPAIMRAYQSARARGRSTSKVSGDYVEWHEFRFFLVALRDYFGYFQLFATLDIDGDRRIDFEEFLLATKRVKQWAVEAKGADKDRELNNVFRRLDVNGGGYILFNEFCRWAIDAHLTAEEEEKNFGSTASKTMMEKLKEWEMGDAEKVFKRARRAGTTTCVTIEQYWAQIERQIFKLFRKYDKDASGTIDHKEMIPAIRDHFEAKGMHNIATLPNACEKYATRVIDKLYDKDQEDGLDYDEFTRCFFQLLLEEERYRAKDAEAEKRKNAQNGDEGDANEEEEEEEKKEGRGNGAEDQKTPDEDAIIDPKSERADAAMEKMRELQEINLNKTFELCRSTGATECTSIEEFWGDIKDHIVHMWGTYDQDGSGLIDSSELIPAVAAHFEAKGMSRLASLPGAAEKYAKKAIYRLYDRDHDGVLNFEEFAKCFFNLILEEETYRAKTPVSSRPSTGLSTARSRRKAAAAAAAPSSEKGPQADTKEGGAEAGDEEKAEVVQAADL